MIILKIRSQDASQVSLVQHDHMIQTLSPDRADQAFCVRILPRRARRRDHFFDVHVPYALLENMAVDSVAITNQKSRRRLFGERFDNLLGRPICGRMRRNVEMNDMPSIVAQHNKGEEYAESSRRDGEAR